MGHCIRTVIMKGKFKPWWSTIPPISRKQTASSQVKSLNTKKRVTSADGNACLGLRQVHKCGRVKHVTGMD
jgi:hypothetical protein